MFVFCITEEWKRKLKCWSASHKLAERKSHPNWLFFLQRSSQSTFSESEGVTNGYSVKCTWYRPTFSESKGVTNGWSVNCIWNPFTPFCYLPVFVWRQKEIANFESPLCVLLICKPDSCKLCEHKMGLHGSICLAWLLAFDCAWHH